MKKFLSLFTIILLTVGLSVFADNARVRRASAAWDMDLEVIQYLPLKVSFAQVGTPNGATTKAFAFSEAAEFRVNFKYLYLAAFLDYTYQEGDNGSSSTTTKSHIVVPMFRLGGRIPVLDVFWIELFGGFGGYFNNQTVKEPSGGITVSNKTELKGVAFQLGINLRFFLNDLISLNGGAYFMGAYPKGRENGGAWNDDKFDVYTFEAFAGIGFNFL